MDFLLVDSFSRFSAFYGLPHITTEDVISIILQYGADHWVADNYSYLDIECIRADAGSEFTAGAFREFFRDNKINLSLAPPNHQDNNYFAERSWQTIHRMAQSMMVHACLPDKYHFHAIHYATAIFNILPVQGLNNPEGEPCTPYELFCNKKPTIGHFRVRGVPAG